MRQPTPLNIIYPAYQPSIDLIRDCMTFEAINLAIQLSISAACYSWESSISKSPLRIAVYSPIALSVVIQTVSMTLKTLATHSGIAFVFLFGALRIKSFAAQIPVDFSNSNLKFGTNKSRGAFNLQQYSVLHHPYAQSDNDPIFNFSDDLIVSWDMQVHAKPNVVHVQCWKEPCMLSELVRNPRAICL